MDCVGADTFSFEGGNQTIIIRDCLALVVDECQLKALDENEYCGVLYCGVFADMSKAFDRVNHQGLINELQNVRIAGTALAWFAWYLTNPVQRVRVG